MPGGLELLAQQWGAESLLALMVLAIILGWLIPLRSHNKTVKLLTAQKDEALDREQFYMSANEKLNETVRLQAQQLDRLLVNSERTLGLVEEMSDSTHFPSSGRHHRG